MLGLFTKSEKAKRYFGSSTLDSHFNSVFKIIDSLKKNFFGDKNLKEIANELDLAFIELRKNPAQTNEALFVIQNCFRKYDNLKKEQFSPDSDFENLKGHYTEILKLIK